MREVKRVLNICKEYNDPTAWRTVIENNLNESSYMRDWTTGLYINAGITHAASVTRDLSRGKAEAPVGIWEQQMIRYAEESAGNNIVIVTGTFRDAVVDELQKMLADDFNMSIESLASKIYEHTAVSQLWQCRRIAQTESMIAMAESGDMAAKSLNVGFTKQWCISGVGNTRETHMILDGVTIDENEYFEVGNDRMLYPHDKSMAPAAGEIINCACTCIRRPK